VASHKISRKDSVWLATALSTLLIAGWFIAILADMTLRRHTLDLKPISAPPRLADTGFTSTVVTQRLGESINELFEQARMLKVQTWINADVLPDMSSVIIPKVGISVESIAGLIRGFLPKDWRHEVTGEFTLVGDRLGLRLRLNGQTVYSESETDLGAAEKLIKSGAFHVVEANRPLIAALLLLDVDKAAARAGADNIIASSLPGDEDVKRAYNLKGRIATLEGKTDEAISQYRKANWLGLDQTYYSPHIGLGFMWLDKGDTAAALAGFDAAIRLDPHSPNGHGARGMVYQMLGKADQAAASYSEAIRVDPTFPEWHYIMGSFWQQQKKMDKAAAEYREAIRLGPKRTSGHELTLAAVHSQLAKILQEQGSRDEARAEYRKAVVLDPKFFLAHQTHL